MNLITVKIVVLVLVAVFISFQQFCFAMDKIDSAIVDQRVFLRMTKQERWVFWKDSRCRSYDMDSVCRVSRLRLKWEISK